jgi:diacylglycerol kinase (ATP)
MSEVKKVLFIINRFSGTGYTPDLEQLIVLTGRKYNAEVTLEFTKEPGHATALASQGQRDGADIVVAVGGDGTLNEVAQGLVGSSVPMGMVPRGSGNGLARHLNVPLITSKAIDNIFSGTILAMDTFTLNGRLSLNVSGIGFDGHIANLFGGRTKRGLAGYTQLALSEFMSFKEFDFSMTTGSDTQRYSSFIVAIANSSQYGNNACVAPAASVTDGKLDVNILRKVPLYRFDFVFAFFNKSIDRSPYARIHSLNQCRITTDVPVPFHVDGEPCGKEEHFEIVMQPATLPIIVPSTTWRGRPL